MATLEPKAHMEMHYLCGETLDGVPRPSLTREFGLTNVTDLADLVYAGPSGQYG
ncbi:MAG: hypothetical protein KDI90_09800 [Alphaproteobacteria bacterium]|nr:hypothetical protein [Alphaproteobacteria bacterium]MCB9974752.1 hypothetical protein [Rhodospirillales bacterium]